MRFMLKFGVRAAEGKCLSVFPNLEEKEDEWAMNKEEAFPDLHITLHASNQGLGLYSCKEQGREHSSRNVVVPRPTNVKKEGGGADKTYYDLRDMYGGHVWRRILLSMLPRSSSGYDTNWVIVDSLTKKALRTRLKHAQDLSSQMDGQSERTIQTSKDMLRAVEVGDKVMLEVSSWKDVDSVFDVFKYLKKYLADTNLHVHLEEIKVDKTLHFVEEPVEIIDREVKSLKRSRIPIVKSIGTRSEVMRIS
ncbi:hypothetical protein Tco_1064447 [Tanacetum coccineum]